MAIIFNESTIAAETLDKGAACQHLLTNDSIPGTTILLDRVTLSTASQFTPDLPPGCAGWLQMLSGDAVLSHAGSKTALSATYVVSLPPGQQTRVTTNSSATFLLGRIPDATRFDPALTAKAADLRIVDWSREPVLDSEHDARKRIYLVTPKLSGTKAIKGEMIFYPPGTAAANHHHEGAEHFMYVLRGRGTVYANEQPFAVRAGDVIYYPDRERHYLSAAPDQELAFAEFFAPGEFVTVWVDPTQVCAWLPTGRDIQGRAPVRNIRAHSSAEVASPQDV